MVGRAQREVLGQQEAASAGGSTSAVSPPPLPPCPGAACTARGGVLRKSGSMPLKLAGKAPFKVGGVLQAQVHEPERGPCPSW